MSVKLNILGAQRVKALIEVLEQQKNDHIEELQKKLMTTEEIRAEVDAEFGVTELRKRLKELKREAEGIANQIKTITGEDIEVSVRHFYDTFGSKRTKYFRRIDDKKAEVREIIKQVEKQYQDKIARLWLCETLDQARRIVYGEQAEK